MIPARLRKIASVTLVIASSWPITRTFNVSSKAKSFSLSEAINLFIGIPVHLEITSETLSTVTFSWSKASSDSFASRSAISLVIFGISPYWSLEASCKLPSCIYLSCKATSLFFWFFNSLIWSNEDFSSFHFAFNAVSCSVKEAIRSLISFKRFTLSSLLSSFSIEILSISNRFFSRVIPSNSSGKESISIRIEAHASSIKSIALSGKKRSVIYLCDKLTAPIIALSLILTPWCLSKESFKPRKIAILSSIVGSSTCTFWKRLSRAASFSIYCLYSSRVVAPIQWSSPRANIGFNKLAASIAPSVLPAPTNWWISSINKMIFPFAFLISPKTAFNLSSNSPRYLAPATSEPKSSSYKVLFCKEIGTSFL